MSNKKLKKTDDDTDDDIVLDGDSGNEGESGNLLDMEASTTSTTTKSKETSKRNYTKNKTAPIKKPKQTEESEDNHVNSEMAQDEPKSFKPFLTIEDGTSNTAEEEPTHLINVKSVDQCESIFLNFYSLFILRNREAVGYRDNYMFIAKIQDIDPKGNITLGKYHYRISPKLALDIGKAFQKCHMKRLKEK